MKSAKPARRLAAALCFLCVFLYNGCARGDAASAIVIEETTGRVLYQMNARASLPMASTTKVMTALVAMEQCPLDDIVTAGDNAFGVPGTSIYLEKGESLTLEQMLYGLMLSSGNDAAVAIAEHVAGSVEAFCAMMNRRAQEIGCTGTHFSTPHGLPADEHYATAADLALIAREAMRHSAFRRIVSTQRATIPWVSHPYDRVLTNKNKLLTAYPGAIGIKTGYTKAAGRCLVFAAERGGMTVIGVVLACPDWFDQAGLLLDKAFAEYEMARAYAAGDAVITLPVTGGVSDQAAIGPAFDVASPVRKGALTDIALDLPPSLAAGFEKGDAVGHITLSSEGETLLRVPLVALEGVKRATFHTALGRAIDRWLAFAP